MDSATARQQQLQDWARGVIQQQFGCDPGLVRAGALGGDASFRRYFRFVPDAGCRAEAMPASLMLVDAPPAQENNPAFLRAAEEFRNAGLCTPRIYGHDLERGFMVQEDFGDQLVLPCLQEAQAQGDIARVDNLYQHAMRSLLMLQGSSVLTTALCLYLCWLGSSALLNGNCWQRPGSCWKPRPWRSQRCGSIATTIRAI